jgi:hypothetical protein
MGPKLRLDDRGHAIMIVVHKPSGFERNRDARRDENARTTSSSAPSIIFARA